MKTYIVTGGAGFIGSALAKRLVEMGNKVYVLDDLSTGFERNIPSGCVFYKVDVSDAEKIFSFTFPSKVDGVFHLAAQPSGEASFDDPARDIEVNYIATYNMLKMCNLVNCERFIYASSMSVYGDVISNNALISETHPCAPVSYYGADKLASERLIGIFVKKTQIKETILRLFNVYGPGQNMSNMKQGMVSIYLSYLMNDIPIHVKGSLSRVRDFIFIDDVIDAFIDCEYNKNAYGQIFNVGTGIDTTVEELLKILLKAYKKEDFNKWVYAQGNTAGDVGGFIADAGKLREILNWAPKYTLGEGVMKMKEWIYKNERMWK
jgi:UDP-glucose 4-epimerase